MKVISKEKAKEMINEGYTFKPHNLYQNEKTAVLVQLGPKHRQAYQVSKK